MMDAPEIVEYACDNVVRIRKCRETVFPWRVAPAYWYIVRPLYTMDHVILGWDIETIREAKRIGYNVVYWSGDKWELSCPQQFASVDDAWKVYVDKVRKV